MKEKWMIIAAFAAMYIIWGSTYLANKFAIEDIPPFLMGGARFFVAGVLLFAFEYWRSPVNPTRQQWLNSIFLGLLFIVFGNGFVVWGLQYVDSGLTALLMAFGPLMVVLLVWIVQKKRPTPKQIIGTLLGLAGMGILVEQPQFTATSETVFALFLMGIAIITWAYGSIMVARLRLPDAKGMGTAIQMGVGGAIMVLYSFLSGEFRVFSFAELSAKSFYSWLFLVVFGSIIAFSSFNYLLHKVSPDKVSTSTYVNPIIAMTLGWAIGGEALTGQSILAAGVLLTGVVFITMR